MNTLEIEARKEFSRILTKATRYCNAALDGRPWGEVRPEELKKTESGSCFVYLEYTLEKQGFTMYASYDAAFLRGAKNGSLLTVLDEKAPEEGKLGYVIIKH